MTSTEYGTIEREIHVEASPEVVFEVITRPEHLNKWWTADADVEPSTGAVGELVWGDRVHVAPIKVVSAEPPRLFSFRWVYADSTMDDDSNSLLVTFQLAPSGTGTTVRLVESGFREMGWADAKVEAEYLDHTSGWNKCIHDLGEYVGRLVSTP